MAAAVETLLRDPGLARRMGAAGRARALAEYSVERMTDAHERIYRACLAQPLAGSDVARA
jgi:glycosyltransferase involved in cell wall biosynthesis